MKKKILLIPLALLLAMSLVATGCPAPPPAPVVEPIILKMNILGPSVGFEAGLLDWVADELEKRTKGRVKFEIYYGSSLLKVKEQLEGVRDGVADIGIFSGTWFPAQTPYQLIINQPMFGPSPEWNEDPTHLVNAYWKWWDETPAVRKELERWNMTVWSLWPFGRYDLFSTVSINSLEDFDGVRVRAVGAKATRMFEAVGAIPVATSPGEVYGALQKGVVEAAWVGLSWGEDYGLAEVSDYVIKISFAEGTAYRPVNLDTLNKMTPGDREVFLELGREFSLRGAEAMRDRVPGLFKGFKAAGMTVIEFPKAERDKWQQMSEMEWIKIFLEEQEKAGVADIRALTGKWLTLIGMPEVMPK